MKKTINRYKDIFQYISNTKTFKTIFLIALIITIYGGYALVANMNNLQSAILFPFTFNYFNLFIFCVFTILTIYTCSRFDQLSFYIIRLKNKKNYIYELLSIVSFVNFFFLITFLMLFLATIIISQGLSFETSKYFYGVTIGQYASFYLIRYFLFLFLIMIIISLFHLLFKSKITLLTVGVILGGFLSSTEYMDFSIVGFQWLPWKYFTTIHYDSFAKEAIFSLIYLAKLIIFILLILYSYLNLQKFRRIKYILINDISYMWNKRKYLLLLWLLVPVIVLLFVNLPSYSNLTDLIESSMGARLVGENDILKIIVSLFFLSLSVFIILDLFLKDIKTNLSGIFIRMKLNEWYINKIIVISLLVLFMKLVSYLIVYLLILSFKGPSGFLNFDIVKLLLIDFINTITVQSMSMIVYLVFNFSKKHQIFAIIGLNLFILIYIYIFSNVAWVILTFVLIIIFTQVIIKNKNKTILQKIGGI